MQVPCSRRFGSHDRVERIEIRFVDRLVNDHGAGMEDALQRRHRLGNLSEEPGKLFDVARVAGSRIDRHAQRFEFFDERPFVIVVGTGSTR